MIITVQDIQAFILMVFGKTLKSWVFQSNDKNCTQYI